MAELILILGGARSGKSSFARRLGQELGGKQVLFVATAEARDEEMKARIEAHRRNRPPSWRTVEAPLGLAEAIHATIKDADVVVIDCISLLVSNVMLGLGEHSDSDAEGAIGHELQGVLQIYQQEKATFIVVSNEVGMGLVPANEVGRLYRDLLGKANQFLASHADRVYWMIAGLPLELKSEYTATGGETWPLRSP